MPKTFLSFVLIASLLFHFCVPGIALDGETMFIELQEFEYWGEVYQFRSSVWIDGMTENGPGELTNFLFSIQQGSDVTLENIILRYYIDDLMMIENMINVATGSLTLINVHIIFEGTAEDVLEISSVRISNRGEASIENCTIYPVFENEIAILCEGALTVTDGSTIWGGIKTQGQSANLFVSNSRIITSRTALIMEKGIATLHSVEMIVTDEASPAIELSDETSIAFDRFCNISWPVFADLSQIETEITGIANDIILPAEMRIETGETARLSPQFDDENAFAPLAWNVDDVTIAAIDSSGFVTALSAGETTIHATIPNGKRASLRLYVSDPEIDEEEEYDDGDADDPPGHSNGEEGGLPGNPEETSQTPPFVYQPTYVYAPTYPDLAPPAKEVAAYTALQFYEFSCEAEIYAAPNQSELIATASDKDFATVLDMNDTWAHILWNGFEGYVPSEFIYSFECTLETMTADAIFTKTQGIYDQPNGTLIGEALKDDVTHSISTRGEWTAIYYDDQVAYTPANGIRLHYSTQNVMFSCESITFLSIAPDALSDVLIYLGPYTPLEIVPIDEELDSEQSSVQWVLAKVGDFIGYIPTFYLLPENPWQDVAKVMSDEDRAQILAQWSEDEAASSN